MLSPPDSPVSSTKTLTSESDVVQVIVGGKHTLFQRFLVQQKPIALRSQFFHRAVNGHPRQSGQTIRLPFDNPLIFQNYLRLLHKGRLPKDLVPLCMLYVLCERIQDVEGKDAIMAVLVQKMRESVDKLGDWRLFYPPDDVVITIIYEGTPDTSPARRLLADTFIRFELADRLKLGQFVLPDEFRDDVTKKNLCLGVRYLRSRRRDLAVQDYMERDMLAQQRASTTKER
ncbi:hypothetical protein K491DRAFT_710846 [Lophiostoma macrostomum CBS 122681]|uniref:BTB domain-containing protein n=1 Tax=Lophiostoma macrostomum CBS 122681 TaxID=1314788 RepID=A0A6A6TSN9_9PLEO|nr:hypothetical protein K491DRAFT_710846 [Lophiostoma macrostomum CBS 122681]